MVELIYILSSCLYTTTPCLKRNYNLDILPGSLIPFCSVTACIFYSSAGCSTDALLCNGHTLVHPAVGWIWRSLLDEWGYLCKSAKLPSDLPLHQQPRIPTSSSAYLWRYSYSSGYPLPIYPLYALIDQGLREDGRFWNREWGLAHEDGFRRHCLWERWRLSIFRRLKRECGVLRLRCAGRCVLRSLIGVDAGRSKASWGRLVDGVQWGWYDPFLQIFEEWRKWIAVGRSGRSWPSWWKIHVYALLIYCEFILKLQVLHGVHGTACCKKCEIYGSEFWGRRIAAIRKMKIKPMYPRSEKGRANGRGRSLQGDLEAKLTPLVQEYQFRQSQIQGSRSDVALRDEDAILAYIRLSDLSLARKPEKNLRNALGNGVFLNMSENTVSTM